MTDVLMALAERLRAVDTNDASDEVVEAIAEVCWDLEVLAAGAPDTARPETGRTLGFGRVSMGQGGGT